MQFYGNNDFTIQNSKEEYDAGDYNTTNIMDNRDFLYEQ